MKRVLALDIATVCGWTVDAADGGDKPVIGHFRSDARGNSAGAVGVEFEVQVVRLIKQHQPNVLSFEAPLDLEALERMNPKHRHGGKPMAVETNNAVVRRLFGLAFVADKIGFQYGLETYECSVLDVRRHFVGNGRAKKPEVFDRCKLLGWSATTLDESDAAALWSFTHAELREDKLRDAVRAQWG